VFFHGITSCREKKNHPAVIQPFSSDRRERAVKNFYFRSKPMKKNKFKIEDLPEKRLNEQEALEAARRCLGEGTCSSCELCSLLCPELCITRNKETDRIQIDLDYCKGCGICASVCPKGAIKMVLETGD
jgi:2-oxoacid:acceptor oxidoreductase delta subunit (pyruvate/2-ketoisovalerate family)